MFNQHEYYDWNNLIDKESRQRLATDINENISAGRFFKNSPKYQTDYNVFGRLGPDANNLKMSFVWSCMAYLGKSVEIQKIQSWSYMTSLKSAEDRDTLWHNHDHDPTTTTVSGVYYLQLPSDVEDLETAGTELAPNGVEGDGKYFAPWKIGNWMIYPGKMWHRPGILQSEKNRYIIAADMEF